jgi:ribosomal protein S9
VANTRPRWKSHPPDNQQLNPALQEIQEALAAAIKANPSNVGIVVSVRGGGVDSRNDAAEVAPFARKRI